MPTINKHLHPWAFRKTKVFFHPFTGEGCTWREQELHPHCFHPLPSSQKYFGIPVPLCLTSKGTTLCWPPPSWGRWRSRTGGSCSAESLSLQCNSLATQRFPTEGPPNADNFTLLLACLWSIPSASCGKAQFLGKQQILAWDRNSCYGSWSRSSPSLLPRPPPQRRKLAFLEMPLAINTALRTVCDIFAFTR